jgi:hypothetical protein
MSPVKSSGVKSLLQIDEILKRLCLPSAAMPSVPGRHRNLKSEVESPMSEPQLP